MNYLPFCGYWFYVGAGTGTIQAFFCSFGLLGTAPSAVISIIKQAMYYFRMLSQ